MTIWEKVGNVTKKINSELIYNKKYLKAEKRFNTKESFIKRKVYKEKRKFIKKMGTIMRKFFWKILFKTFLGEV